MQLPQPSHICVCLVLAVVFPLAGLTLQHGPEIKHQPDLNWNQTWNPSLLNRQGGKDQTKKGPNIKLGPQGDKKGLGQDPRKDSSMDAGHHLKVRDFFLLRKPEVGYLCLICAFFFFFCISITWVSWRS